MQVESRADLWCFEEGQAPQKKKDQDLDYRVPSEAILSPLLTKEKGEESL